MLQGNIHVTATEVYERKEDVRRPESDPQTCLKVGPDEQHPVGTDGELKIHI